MLNESTLLSGIALTGVSLFDLTGAEPAAVYRPPLEPHDRESATDRRRDLCALGLASTLFAASQRGDPFVGFRFHTF